MRVVVITGAGPGFCSGADVRERIPRVVSSEQEHAGELIGGFVRPVWELSKPVIAAVNGVAAGGGFALACAADFRFAVPQARFVAAFTRRGLMPDSGLTYLLPRLVSRSVANRLLFLGGELSGEEALAHGLVDVVVGHGSLMASVAEFAEELARGPAVALSFTKRALQLEGDLQRHLEFESWGQRVCFTTSDFREGMASFAQKREPTFGKESEQ